jgi:hypothetical protein
MWSVPRLFARQLSHVSTTTRKTVFSMLWGPCRGIIRYSKSSGSSSSVEKKNLVVGLKELDAKTNWLAVNRQS